MAMETPETIEKKEPTKIQDDPGKFISSHTGKVVKLGCKAGTIVNPYEVWQNNDGKYVKMKINSEEGIKETFFDYDDLEKVTQHKWWMTRNYVITHKGLYLHHLVTDFKPDGRGTGKKGSDHKSIDHRNREPFDNRKINLGVASREDQEANSKGIMEDTKRNRKKSAKPLPDGLKQEDLPKYVVYYIEKYGNDKFREYFRIEKHPRQKDGTFLNKWHTTKAMTNITIRDKLQEAKNKLKEMNETKAEDTKEDTKDTEKDSEDKVL